MRRNRSFVGRGEPAGLADAPFAGAAVIVLINNLWWRVDHGMIRPERRSRRGPQK
jgi:hypothetical protein